MSKHHVSDMPYGQWGSRGSGRPWRAHPPGRWWHKATHKPNQHRESVSEIHLSLIEQEKRARIKEARRLVDLKRKAERLACENRTGTVHLSADGEYYCWHTKLVIGPDMPADQSVTLRIPVPEDVVSISALVPEIVHGA